MSNRSSCDIGSGGRDEAARTALDRTGWGHPLQRARIEHEGEWVEVEQLVRVRVRRSRDGRGRDEAYVVGHLVHAHVQDVELCHAARRVRTRTRRQAARALHVRPAAPAPLGRVRTRRRPRRPAVHCVRRHGALVVRRHSTRAAAATWRCCHLY